MRKALCFGLKPRPARRAAAASFEVWSAEQPENQGRHHDDDHQKHSRKETDLLLMRRQVSLGRFLSHNFWLITFGCDKEAIVRYPKEKEPGQKPKKPDS